MDVVCSSELDEGEYAAFLDGFAPRAGAALGYHYPFYLRFLAGVAYPGSVLRMVTARREGMLVGVLPGLHLRTSRLSAWLSLAYFGPNAGALVVGDHGAVVEALASAARADAAANGCGSMTMYAPLGADPAPYRRALGADYELHRISQWLPLPANADTSPWPRKVRYDIRRAASLGVTVRAIADGDELDRVWDIYRDGCEAVGIPLKPREHVRHLYGAAGRHGIFLLAEHGGEIAGGLVAFMGGGVLSYYLPCTRADKRSLQPGLALLDRAIALAREAGCRVLNFESSPGVESSVYKFKARCGGEPVDYRVFVALLRDAALGEYRALGRDGLTREAPHAFIVPFEALR